MSDTQQAVLNKSRKDKYIMILSLPKCFRNINVTKQTVPDNSQVNLDTLQFSMYGSPVPEIIVPEMVTPFSGQNIMLSSHSREAYQPLSVLFTVDNEYKNYWYIWKWLDLLNGAKKGIADPNKLLMTSYDPTVPTATNTQLRDYTTNISIIGYDEYNQPKIEFKYIGALATRLGRIEYNYRDSGEIECSFTFAFSQMDSILTNINP